MVLVSQTLAVCSLWRHTWLRDNCRHDSKLDCRWEFMNTWYREMPSHALLIIISPSINVICREGLLKMIAFHVLLRTLSWQTLEFTAQGFQSVRVVLSHLWTASGLQEAHFPDIKETAFSRLLPVKIVKYSSPCLSWKENCWRWLLVDKDNCQESVSSTCNVLAAFLTFRYHYPLLSLSFNDGSEPISKWKDKWQYHNSLLHR